MPNVWKWQAKNAKGEIVEAAPGQAYFESRGPTTKASMVQAANILLYSKRMEAHREGIADPGYVLDVDSITPVGDTATDSVPLGFWNPDGKPLNLPTDPAVNAARDARLAAE